MQFPIITQKEPRLQALSMDEYAEFVAFCLKHASPEQVRAQKMREEQITIPFSFDDACTEKLNFKCRI